MNRYRVIYRGGWREVEPIHVAGVMLDVARCVFTGEYIFIGPLKLYFIVPRSEWEKE